MAMLKPFRLRVLEALTQCIEGVTLANGYQHDLEGKVFRGRLAFGEDDPLPMIAIIEPPIPIDQLHDTGESANRKGDWDLLIQGFAKDDQYNPTDPAYYLMADVQKALASEKIRGTKNFDILGMGKKVISLRIGTAVVRPPEEQSAKAYFYMPITLEIAEELDKPFN